MAFPTPLGATVALCVMMCVLCGACSVVEGSTLMVAVLAAVLLRAGVFRRPGNVQASWLVRHHAAPVSSPTTRDEALPAILPPSAAGPGSNVLRRRNGGGSHDSRVDCSGSTQQVAAQPRPHRAHCCQFEVAWHVVIHTTRATERCAFRSLVLGHVARPRAVGVLQAHHWTRFALS